MKLIILILIMFLGITQPIIAQDIEVIPKDNPNSLVGRASMVWLLIDGDLRSAGMGGASTAGMKGIRSVFSNPAGFVFAEGTQFYGSYMKWLTFFNYTSLAISKSFGNFGNIGLFGIYISSDEMDRYLATTSQPIGTFQTYHAALGLTYANSTTSQFSWGFNLKVLQEDLGINKKATAYAVDVGAVFDIGFKGARIGALMRNYGTDVKFYELASPLPLEFRVGVAFDLFETIPKLLSSDHTLFAEFNASKSIDYEMIYNLGFEYNFNNQIFARLGLPKLNYTKDDLEGFSFGAGIEYSKFRLEYTTTDMSSFGYISRFGFSLKF